MGVKVTMALDLADRPTRDTGMVAAPPGSEVPFTTKMVTSVTNDADPELDWSNGVLRICHCRPVTLTESA